jgi:hypothetical protein
MTETIKLATKIYITTQHSFIKSEYAPSELPKNIHGNPVIWKWGAQHLQNEGTALALVAKLTTIPVPRVLFCGQDERGVMRLEVERKDGLLCDTVGEECRMTPDWGGHSARGRCSECEKIAFCKVSIFIETTVLPQLKTLTSTETGLNGFVLPPPRIEEYDRRDIWLPKQAPQGQKYVLCHGDFSRSNILLDPMTLDVMCIIDWECAGFFPAELECPLWRLDYNEYMQTYYDTAMIQQEIWLIT